MYKIRRNIMLVFLWFLESDFGLGFGIRLITDLDKGLLFEGL
jgi:hypothetical protein